jgi:general secretion pathway protein D
MAMCTRNSRNAIIVILAALLIGGLSSAAWTFQEPRRAPASEEEKKRALESLTKQVQSIQPSAKPATQPAAPQPQTAPQPPPATQPQPPTPAQPAPATPPAVPPAATTPARGVLQLNFENEDLYNFITQISSTLGLAPLIIDPEVKGSVNLNSGPMAKEDILPLFTLILKNNNAALIRQGGTYMIVPISSALKKGVDIIEKLPASPSEIPQVDPAKKPASNTPVRPATGSSPTQESDSASKTPRLATHVIRAEFIPVKDLVEPIKLFMTEGGIIMPYERLNMLILTDYTDSVARILQIVRMLDNNYLDPDLVELVKINYNASADVVEDLKKMFGAGTKDSATGISFISLDRLNAIFVMASSKRALEEVKAWIKTLDSSSSKNIQTYVYIVENSTASNIAMMLSALYGGEGISSGTSSTSGGGTSAGGGAVSGARNVGGNVGMGTSGSSGSSSPFGGQAGYGGGQMGGYGGGQMGGFGGGIGSGQMGGYGGGGLFGGGRQLGPQLNVQRTVTSQVLRGGEFTGLQDTVRMVVDDINNSLIIQATPADYAYISETIKKMDVLPRQALIDARIFEVDLTDALSFGVTASLQPKSGNSGTTASLASSGLLTATTFIPIGSAREIMASIEALRLKTKVKVLEAPAVLALDGQQAQIMVGSEIPYPGSSYTPSSGGSTTSVSYRDTGISLIVVPRISASGSVTMDLVQEVSAPGAPTAIGDTSAPSFTKTSVSTTLTVKDGETVAIAGLIRENSNFSRSGIPFLSEIPILGSLFGQTRKGSNRTELIIMITPHVIRTPEKLKDMTRDLKDSLRNVRKYADEKTKEIGEDKEKAREERYEQEQKALKDTEVPKTEAPGTKPTPPPDPKQPK